MPCSHVLFLLLGALLIATVEDKWRHHTLLFFFFQLFEIMKKYRNNMKKKGYKEGTLFAFLSPSMNDLIFQMCFKPVETAE